jgi:hypothetical protein
MATRSPLADATFSTSGRESVCLVAVRFARQSLSPNTKASCCG